MQENILDLDSVIHVIHFKLRENDIGLSKKEEKKHCKIHQLGSPTNYYIRIGQTDLII